MTAYADALVGWRVWLVRDGRLLSWSQDAVWPERERMQARCRRILRAGCTDAPRLGHACGIYAARTREAVERLAAFPSPVAVAIGRVSLWGRVVENTGGFRAQYAYPYDLELRNVADAEARVLRARYAVDVA